MNTRTKAFGISFGFHALMALIALSIVGMMHPPQESIRIPIKMVLLSPDESVSPLPAASPRPLHPNPSTPVPARPVPMAQTANAPAPQPSQPVAAASVPAVSHSVPLAAVTNLSERPAEHIPPAASAAPVSDIKPSALTVPAPVKAQPKTDFSAELQAFKTALRSKIQQNLHYPSAARRRGMEGEVDVRFVLETSGSIRDIAIRNGESIFHDAARLAVASVSGMKVPESLASRFPDELALTLEFRLN